MVRDTGFSCQAPLLQPDELLAVVSIFACDWIRPPGFGAPVLLALHTCITQEGPPPEVRENGRLTEVMVKLPFSRNMRKPNAAITQFCATHLKSFAVEPCV